MKLDKRFTFILNPLNTLTLLRNDCQTPIHPPVLFIYLNSDQLLSSKFGGQVNKIGLYPSALKTQRPQK